MAAKATKSLHSSLFHEKKNLTGEAVFSPSLEVYNKVHIPYEKRISDSQNPRMICIGQNFKAHSIPTLCHEQGPLSRDQVAPRPLQPSLSFLGWSNLCQGLTTLAAQNFFKLFCTGNEGKWQIRVQLGFVRFRALKDPPIQSASGLFPGSFVLHFLRHLT